MSAMVDDNLGKIFTSFPRLLVHLKLLWALFTARLLEPEEGKVHMGADVSFPRADGTLFVLTRFWSLPRYNASSHLRILSLLPRGGGILKNMQACEQGPLHQKSVR